MKPLKLILSAFGPYASRQVIDFQDLAGRTLFLIHGKTGSGKTTILDAICYALYGACSGGHREPKQVRSHHAAENTPTQVTFEFALGQNIYRICRKAEGQKLNRRGQLKPAAQQADLSVKQNGQFLVKCARWTEVTNQVKELIGFEVDQFRQVVMLPQGEFLKLLHSNSKDRQLILEVLFETQVYRKIEELLKQTSGDLQIEIKEKNSLISFILKQEEVETYDDLITKSCDLIANHEECAKLVTEHKSRLDTARLELTSATAINNNFIELDEAQEAFGSLEEKKSEYQKLNNKLERALRAEKLIPVESNLLTRQKEADQAQTKIVSAQRELAAAELNLKKAQENHSKESIRRGSLDNLKRQLNEIDRNEQKAKQLSDVRKEYERALAKFGDKDAHYGELKTKRDALRERLEAAALEKEAADKLAGTAPTLDLELKVLRELNDLNKQVAGLEKEIAAAQAEAEKHELLVVNLASDMETAQISLDHLETLWIHGQSAILAKNLTPGEPCPVCGSSEHPAPAEAAGALPEREAINLKKLKITNLRSEIDNRNAMINKLRSSIAELSGKYESYHERLANSNYPPTEIAGRIKLLNSNLKDAQKALAKSEELLNCIKGLGHETTRIEMNIKEAEEVRDASHAALKHLQGALESIANEVPDEFTNFANLVKTRKRVERQINEIETSFERAQKELEMIAANKEAAAGRLDSLKESSLDMSRALLEQKMCFESELKNASFSDVRDFSESKRSTEQIVSFREDLKAFNEALSSAKDRLLRAQKITANLQRPKMNEISEQVRKLELTHEKMVAEEISLRAKIDGLQGHIADYNSRTVELEGLTKKAEVTYALSDVAAGNNPGKITFQRFVLTALLDDVLTAASERLKIMSNARYQLKRQASISDRRTSGGLDLEVHDSYTGTERDVKTLSGGESFLASLSLALGLADVVQAYAGGIRLDTIFVDEGFGSLDTETLDLAMKALMDLQKSGRLIGIISHVGELRERIDARLEVSTSPVGSRASFVLGGV